MLFTTDNQTQEDLNIYGKQGTDSILSLFNRTLTVNGSKLLEELFRYPLSDAGTINERSEKIRYLKTVQAAFPFSSELFDQAEQYLANRDERTKLPAEKPSLEKMLTSLVASNADYKQIINGISALIEIIQLLNNVLNNTLVLAGSPFKKDAETTNIRSLLSTEPISLLLSETPERKLPHEKLAAYDVMLRFRHGETVQQILGYIYQLDVFISIAKVATDRKYVFAKALPKTDHLIKIDAFYHPQLNNAVANSIHITADSNVVFLTGANMAGKSTFMKSLGIAMYLAHMGFPIAARRMEFSVKDGLFSSINVSDNLDMGYSHFYAEVLRTKTVAQAVSESQDLYVLFDELFKGTNVKDAYDATLAVCKAFAENRNSFFVVSTHIIEVGEALGRACDNLQFSFLPTIMKDGVPTYPYTLEPGITTDRQGMIIIENEKIIEIIQANEPVKN